MSDGTEDANCKGKMACAFKTNMRNLAKINRLK